MIDEVLHILKDKLNDYFKLKFNSSEDKVAFIDGAKTDPISFPLNFVVPVLINVEEEKVLRAPNRYEGVINNGIKSRINPSISINLTVLFVSRFADYEQSLKFLSYVIRFFQANPILNQFNTPTLNNSIDKLKLELLSLTNGQKNELWSSLRTTYLPSLVYRVSMLVYHDEDTTEFASTITEIQTTVEMKKQ